MPYGELVEHLLNKINRFMCPLDCGFKMDSSEKILQHYKDCPNISSKMNKCALFFIHLVFLNKQKILKGSPVVKKVMYWSTWAKVLLISLGQHGRPPKAYSPRLWPTISVENRSWKVFQEHVAIKLLTNTVTLCWYSLHGRSVQCCF